MTLTMWLTSHREESERVSELKSVSGSTKLPHGTLALGAEGIKDAIKNFEDARRSDIENERLPPELIDADSDEAKARLSQPPSPSGQGVEAVSSPALASALEEVASASGSASSSAGPVTPASPITPVSPNSLVSPFRSGHRRQASLGTTMTSPSTRRRSLENTISLIKEVVDGGDSADPEWEKLADDLMSGDGKDGATPAPAR
jgi:serine/threonine-protein phosphatase 2B catalytic subunit